MKALIVNADDFGYSERRNAGIVFAHQRGIVTAASLLTNGRAFSDAVALSQENPSLDLGLHLNLSEGIPLEEGHRSLVDETGEFFGRREAQRRAGAGMFDPFEIARETEAQILRLRECGIRISHLDGHQHLHVYGNIPEVVAGVASRHGIRCVRIPADTLVPEARLDARRRGEIEDLQGRALRALKTYARARLRSTEHFGGTALTGHLGFETLVETLRRVSDGVTELVVHPGRADDPNGFSGPEREREMRTLSDARLKPVLEAAGIELTTFERI